MRADEHAIKKAQELGGWVFATITTLDTLVSTIHALERKALLKAEQEAIAKAETILIQEVERKAIARAEAKLIQEVERKAIAKAEAKLIQEAERKAKDQVIKKAEEACSDSIKKSYLKSWRSPQATLAKPRRRSMPNMLRKDVISEI